MSDFHQVGEDELYRGHLFSLYRVRWTDPAGEAFERDVIRHPGAVAVVPVHADGTVTLVRQMRAAVGETVLEVPAGTCDVAGEAAETTARRELAEEAGLQAQEVEHLISLYNSPGYTSQRTTVFLATGLEPTETDRDGIEEHWMTVETVALSDLEALVAEGRLVDGTTVAGLFLARSVLARRGRIPEA